MQNLNKRFRTMMQTGDRRQLLCAAGTLLFCLAGAFFIMMICTRSSFLYPYNNWDDSNSYFTVGKSWLHGYIPYKDIFDQKGPWLYFVYGLCSLVSLRTFAGVFIMEILIAAADIYLMGRIASLYMPRWLAFIIALPAAALMFSSRSFYWGGCSEELLLPFLLWPLFLLLKHYRYDAGKAFDRNTIRITGFCCGMAAATKFILLGFYFAYMVIVLAEGIASGRKRGGSPKETIVWCVSACLHFLLFFILPFLPFVIWFGAKGALGDWYRDYIYTNVFLYSSFGANSKGEGILSKIHSLALIFYWLIRQNPGYMIPSIVGSVLSLFRGKNWIERLSVPFLFGMLFVGIFIGGSELPYYSMPLTAFAVTGFAFVFAILCRAFGRSGKKPLPPAVPLWAKAAASAVVLIISVLISFLLTMNRYYMSYEKEDMFLYHFTKVIEEDGLEDPSMFNYNCLDCGLLTAAGLYPGKGCYWFQTQTIPTTEVLDEQHRYIKEGLTDYIVARASYPDFIFDKYELAASFDQVMGNNGELSFTYYLFRRKTDQ